MTNKEIPTIINKRAAEYIRRIVVNIIGEELKKKESMCKRTKRT